MSMTQKRLSASFSDNPSPFIAARSPSATPMPARSEEHTSELQSRLHLVCRLLLEKKKKTIIATTSQTNKSPRSSSRRSAPRSNHSTEHASARDGGFVRLRSLVYDSANQYTNNVY